METAELPQGSYVPSPHQVRLATRLAGYRAADIVYTAQRHVRRGIAPEVRDVVCARPGADRCAYCTVPVHPEAPVSVRGVKNRGRFPGDLRTIDHVIAIANGGANKAHNMVTACRGCNKEKADLPAHVFLDSVWLQARRRQVTKFLNRQAQRGAATPAQGRRTGLSNRGALLSALHAA